MTDKNDRKTLYVYDTTLTEANVELTFFISLRTNIHTETRYCVYLDCAGGSPVCADRFINPAA